VDAIVRGTLSPDEVASLRAEIAGGLGGPAAVAGDDGDDDQRTLPGASALSSSSPEGVQPGDLGDLTGRTSPTRSLLPEYDALLVETYLTALGGPASVPTLAVRQVDVAALPLGPQAAFVLSRIDGASSIEDVLDMSVLARVETLRILCELLQRGIIRVEGLDE
jgi:hypothetical protein